MSTPKQQHRGSQRLRQGHRAPPLPPPHHPPVSPHHPPVSPHQVSPLAPPLYSDATQLVGPRHGSGGAGSGGASGWVDVDAVPSVLCCEGRSGVFYRVPCSAISHLPASAATSADPAPAPMATRVSPVRVAAAHADVQPSRPHEACVRREVVLLGAPLAGNEGDNDQITALTLANNGLVIGRASATVDKGTVGEYDVPFAGLPSPETSTPPLPADADNRRGGAWLICWDHTLGQCRKGRRCRFAHVDVPVATLAPLTYHQRFVWRDVRYVVGERLSTAGERAMGLPAGALEAAPLLVLGVNKKGAKTTVPAGRLLRTRGALESLTYALKMKSPEGGVGVGVTSHCAHYHLSGRCERGPDCAFAHVLYFEPLPQPNVHHRPPPPSTPLTSIAGTGADDNDDHDNTRRQAPSAATDDTLSSSSSNWSVGGPALARSRRGSAEGEREEGDGAEGPWARASSRPRTERDHADPRIAALDAMLAELGVAVPFPDSVHSSSSLSPTPLVEASLAAVSRGAAAADVPVSEETAASRAAVVRRPHACPYGLSPPESRQ